MPSMNVTVGSLRFLLSENENKIQDIRWLDLNQQLNYIIIRTGIQNSVSPLLGKKNLTLRKSFA